MLDFLFNVFMSPDTGGEGGEPTNPLRDEAPSSDPVDNASDDQQTEDPVDEVEEVDFGGRKVKVIDPAIKDLHGDWTELSGTLTREQQQRKQLEEELEDLRAKLETSKQPDEPSQPTEDRLREISEKYAEMAYDDPVGAMIWLNQQPEYQQALKPIHEQSVQSVLTETQQRQAQIADKIKTQANELSAKYPDYLDNLTEMDAVIEQYPHLQEQMKTNPTKELMESVYFMAKGRTFNPTSEKKPEELLQDDEFVQSVVQNESIRNKIIQDYLDQVNNNQQTPQIVPSGGQAPSLPDQPLETVGDGTKAFKAMLKKVGL